MMRALSLLCVALATLATPSQAETVFGHVYADGDASNTFDPLIDGPLAFEIVTIRSELGDFEQTTLTDPFGMYEFFVPPGIYEIVLPFAEAGVVEFGRVLQTPSGPLELPGGSIIVMPGDTLEVDLPVTGASAPVFASPIAPNVVAGGISSNPEIEPRGANLNGSVDQTGGEMNGSTDFLRYLDGIEVSMIFLDANGDPDPSRIGLATMTTGGLFFFDGAPLQDGDRVRVSVDPDQPALEGFAPVFPTSRDITYDAVQGMTVTEFRFNPVKDITGRVFVDVVTKKKTFSIGLPFRRIQLLDFSAEEPTVLAETYTNLFGHFRFDDRFHGVYTVRLVKGRKDRVLAETVRLLLGDVDPAPVEFSYVVELKKKKKKK